MSILISLIAWGYYFLIFAVPLVLYPHTSEIFEFNKLILTYLTTIAVIFLWSSRMIFQKRIIFKRTKLDIPILIFLATLTITTLFSIDRHTSFYGYYSRFHGGLLSYITYSLLYWGFVSNLKKEHAVKALHAFVLSSLLVSVYAVLQHFGIDKDLWVQDVQTRVFSTLGQPNWLAAWIVALIPLSWVYIHTNGNKQKIDFKSIFLGNYWVSVGFFVFYYLVLSYTRSRSGFIALIAIGVLYSIFALYFNRTNISVLLKKAAIPIVILIIYALLAGTPFTPSLIDKLEKSSAPTVEKIASDPEQSENEQSGDSTPDVSFSSKEIRYIVWEGAFDVWKNNPILGTGPETFAYSYYEYRPAEHNLVSEWDFLYNKAHNEYLNQLATTGILGTLGYLIYHAGVIFILFTNFKNDSKDTKFIHIAMLAGFISIIITNFIGFSVVPVALQIFIYPGLSVALLNYSNEDNEKIPSINGTQKIYIFLAALASLFLIIRTINYWRADLLYAKGQQYNDAQIFQQSSKFMTRAIELRDNESVYWQELAEAQAGLSILLLEVDEDLAKQLARDSYESAEQAEAMNPHDVNNIRKQASTQLKLSYVDESYLNTAEDTVKKAIKLAPTEAKLIYNLGAIQLQLGKFDQALTNLNKAIELRPMYIDARYALSLTLIELDQENEAREQLNYILDKLNPDDHRALESLRNLDNK